MADVLVDQYVICIDFKRKPTFTIKDKKELILSKNPINTSN